jgi:hypothetical protein
MRTLGIELFDEGVEPALLLQEILPCRTRGFLLQSPMHALMPAVLLVLIQGPS